MLQPQTCRGDHRILLLRGDIGMKFHQRRSQIGRQCRAELSPGSFVQSIALCRRLAESHRGGHDKRVVGQSSHYGNSFLQRLEFAVPGGWSN